MRNGVLAAMTPILGGLTGMMIAVALKAEIPFVWTAGAAGCLAVGTIIGLIALAQSKGPR